MTGSGKGYNSLLCSVNCLAFSECDIDAFRNYVDGIEVCRVILL